MKTQDLRVGTGTKPKTRTSPVLAVVAALCTSGAAMLSGVTTTGMLVRMAVAAGGFWAVGVVFDHILAWASDNGSGSALAPGRDTSGQAIGTAGAGPEAKGQHVDVRLPAVAPGAGKKS